MLFFCLKMLIAERLPVEASKKLMNTVCFAYFVTIGASTDARLFNDWNEDSRPRGSL
jgi:hypothetical protein